MALFLSSLSFGGSQRAMVNLANGLVARGSQADLVLATGGDAFRAELDGKVRVVNLRAKRVLGSFLGLIRYLREVRPDVLLTTQLHANLVALWACRLAAPRTRVVVRQGSVLTPRDDQGSARQRLMRWMARRGYRGADAIVAVSHGVARDLARVLGLPLERIRVIYNPVIRPKLGERARQPVDHPWFAPGAPAVVLSAGRLTAQKDFPTLIRALSLLRHEEPARLVILGEGEERPRLEALVQELGLEAAVSMPGAVQNPEPYMARARVYVLCSRWEGCPNALIEALGVGTPAVATDCPSGPREVLEGRPWGVLVPPGNADALAAGILRILRDLNWPTPDVRDLARFSFESCVDAYVDVLGLWAAGHEGKGAENPRCANA